MKTVSAALGAELKRRNFKPVVQVKVDDRRNAGVSPTVWSSVYSSAATDAGHGAAVVSGGYLCEYFESNGELRGRRTLLGEVPGGPMTWSKLAPSAVVGAQVAACAVSHPVYGELVYVVYVDDDGYIRRRLSTNGGESFSDSWVVADARGYVVNSLAAVAPGKDAHELVVLYCRSVTGDEVTADKEVRVAYTLGGGVWSELSWGRAAGKASLGLGAVAFDCDALHSEVTFVLAGKFEALGGGYNCNAYHLTLDWHGNMTVSHVGVVRQLDGSNRVAWPSMVTESEHDRARIFYQYYDAALPAAKRWQSYQTFVYELLSGDDIQFGAPQAFRVGGFESTLGVARAGDKIYAGRVDSLWSSPVWDGSAKWYVDVSAALLAVEHHVFDNALLEDIEFQPGFAYVFLDNHDGRFLNYGQAGSAYEAIKRGAQVHFLVGYNTVDGVELEALPPMWIDRIFHGQNPRSGASQDVPHLAVQGGPLLGGRYLILKCYDAWTLTTRRGPTPNSVRYTGLAFRKILSDVFMQMGIYYSDDGTARLAAKAGEWVAQAGRPWYHIIRDVLIYCHCRVKFLVEYDKVAGGRPAARAYVFEDRDVSPADLAVGGDGELALYAGMYWEQDRWGGYQYEWYRPAFIPTTIVQAGAFTGAAVDGDGVADYEIDFARVEGLGIWQPRPVVDFRVSSGSDVTAEDRALAASEEPLYCGQVLIPLHPCLEVWDRVHVTDGGSGQGLQKRFVIGIESYYDTKGKRARFEQVVHLMRHVRV